MDTSKLKNFVTRGHNFFNRVYVEIVVYVDYKNNKVVKKNNYFRVYDTMDHTEINGWTPTSDYKLFDTPSAAASRMNTILKQQNYTLTKIDYTALKRDVDDAIKGLQYTYDNVLHSERVEAFSKEFNELLKKYNFHIKAEEDGDYYNDWINYSIIDDMLGGRELYIDDLVKSTDNLEIEK